MDFFQTRMGQQLIEGTMPKVANALERIAVALEQIVEQNVQPANDIAGERVKLASEEDHQRARELVKKHADTLWSDVGGLRTAIEDFFGASTFHANGMLVTITRRKRDTDGFRPQLKLFF